ncbi:nicotinate N-methyltransferase 1-like isoform X2 [Gastrolobium bilobum]|uniref:nicotinate N-methyltransferase 1-like isoform X2 n=1 Tax=Gastrolobium bilobum TaxID=150636 RepID=UPI002AAF2DA6|nr:nicotinate N-methyltransferase 1-like isoform X2 [Gastrolobium bilobum]
MEMKKEVTVTRSQNKARLAILEIAHMMSVPMSLVAVIKMKVPDTIWQDGSNTPLSAAQIIDRIRPHGGADAENLQRILRLLTSYDIFAEHLSSTGERKYFLTNVGKTLVADDEGLSYAPYMLQHHQDALMRAWPLVEEAVEDPTVEPFAKVNGESALPYYMKQPDIADLYHKGLYGMSVPFMRDMLELYDGFQGVKTLVDVGGNSGVSLRMIMEKHPNILQGINYDLPDMVALAPQFPGITHVGGDAFESVPPGDAIFMKWVFSGWTDEECKQVLENCYKALSVDGKLIVCEPVAPELTDESQRTRALLAGDIFVMTITKGKHRTEQQFKHLAISAGFSHFCAFYLDSYFAVLEFHK